MSILVINVGSSSVKVGLFGAADAEEFVDELPTGIFADDAGGALAKLLAAAGAGPIQGVGHRVVHGGARFRTACRIDDSVVGEIESLSPLAPLHNPAAVAGIRWARQRWAHVPQVAVFDTAFHSGMPPEATTYAVPAAWREAGVRRYGFHGISHQYVMERVARSLATEASALRIVSCHLGNGASICAIQGGASIDTSMGMTPLEGLVMGSRPGDLDPAIAPHVHRALGLGFEAIEEVLYRQCGLAALSRHGEDMRKVEAAAASGDADASRALALYAYRARKYIGAYAAAMGGIDVLAFTGGIGENSAPMRERICDRFGYLGLALDRGANADLRLRAFESGQVQHRDSRVRVMVMRAREQWMIAREVRAVLATKEEAPWTT